MATPNNGAYIRHEDIHNIVKEATSTIEDIEGTLREGKGVEGAAVRAVRVLTWIKHMRPFFEEHQRQEKEKAQTLIRVHNDMWNKHKEVWDGDSEA